MAADGAENTAPVLSSASIAEGHYYRTSVIAVAPGKPTDAESPAVSLIYAWVVNGAEVAGQSQSVYTGALAKGDQVLARVTPFDGESSAPRLRRTRSPSKIRSRSFPRFPSYRAPIRSRASWRQPPRPQ